MVKALCLGAKGVGMGRPFMYALTYGEDGVAHAIESELVYSLNQAGCRSRVGLLTTSFRLSSCSAVMRDEIETTMRLLGVTKLSQLGPHLVRSGLPPPLL